MEVPMCHIDNNPHCHSVIEQKLLHIDWKRTHCMQMLCLDLTCSGMLSNDRSNCFKKKTLFPVFGLDGAPIWCVITVLLCPCCYWKFNSNKEDVLINMPACAACFYLLARNYAFRDYSCNLNGHSTEAFSSIVVTHGHGELCNKMSSNGINCDCVKWITIYYSMAKEKNHINGAKTITK